MRYTPLPHDTIKRHTWKAYNTHIKNKKKNKIRNQLLSVDLKNVYTMKNIFKYTSKKPNMDLEKNGWALIIALGVSLLPGGAFNFAIILTLVNSFFNIYFGFVIFSIIGFALIYFGIEYHYDILYEKTKFKFPKWYYLLSYFTLFAVIAFALTTRRENKQVGDSLGWVAFYTLIMTFVLLFISNFLIISWASLI